MSFLSLCMILIIAAASWYIYIFITDEPTIRTVIEDQKIFEITFQFLLITIIGGGVAYLYKALERRREQRRTLREMHAELLNAYNRAKTVRRHLRASLGTKKGVNPTTNINAIDYKEQIEVLSDIQLIFEVYAKRAKDRRLWFWGGLWLPSSKKLASLLTKVEKYLNGIVDEYEEEFAGFVGNPRTQKLSQLKKLGEFIGPHAQALEFQKCFQKPMDNALKTLGKAILR